MKLAALLLLCCSCSMVTPVVDAAKEVTKPATISLATWLMVTLVNPVAGALTAGTMAIVWDTSEVKAENKDLKETAEQTFWRMWESAGAKQKADILAEEAMRRDARLREERSWADKSITLLWYAFFGFVSFWILRHWRDLLRFVNFIKRAFTNVTTSQKP